MLRDPSTAPLDDKHKLLFRFIATVNEEPASITRDRAAHLRGAGWSDEELYFAISVCALFNFYNRWIDASGVHPLSDEAHRQGARRSAIHGYVRE